MPKTPRRYAIYDVFTDTPLAGNPLAVVFDCEGLDPDRMQAIAREFNLSETAFLLPPEDPLHAARVRIFTPRFEMPFAGHPTVGSAVALCEMRDAPGAETASIVVLGENIGPVRCAVKRGEGAAFAEFDLPQLPERVEMAATPETIGAALGLDPQDIGFENHRPAAWSGGVPYVTVPVSGLAAAARARLDTTAWEAIAPVRDNGIPASAYVYCRETVAHDSQFHARMFVGGAPTYEDPATGSAAAAFAGQIVACDTPLDGPHAVWIEQGVEMGRPSRIRLEIEVESDRIKAARIGGEAMKVAEGHLIA
jgi:trans-2,3-dihydro-3-hydroxyanthranilate isomerase